MDSTLKQRLIGAAVLAALAVIFLPMLLKGPDVREPDAAEVPLSMPASPGQDYETRELPLTAPEGETPPGGVLGMAPAPDGASTAIPMPDAKAVAVDASVPVATDAAAPSTESAAPTPAPAIPAAATKPVSTTPAVELPTASVGAGNYVVSIGSFGNLANANSLAAKLRAAGLPVTADRVTIATGAAMRLRVGPYVDRASAEAARLRAETVTGASGKVIVLDAAPSAVTAPKVATATAKPVAPAATAATTPTSVAKPTSASAKPASVAAKPVPLSSGFAVQLSAPSVESEALALRDRARGQGFNSFVQKIDTEGGVRYRVRVGPVADRSAAEAMRDAVNAKLGTKGIVVTNP
jgi:cell division septation protein DedD